ncbi:MAG: nucleotidyltransferase domain-containing protein [Nitrospirae bacterium]|nr:nucleotidyltransferase domain-containing protein [Nitrospirota bacterium]
MISREAIDINKIYSSIVEVAKAHNAMLALVFGSFAKGDYSRRSDIDVIFIEDTKERFIDRIGRYLDDLWDKDALKSFGIDVLVYTLREFEKMKADGNKFILRALKEGKILYEQGKR